VNLDGQQSQNATIVLMTRVLIDGQVFSIHRQGGICRYFASVYGEYLQLAKDFETDVEISLGVSLTKYPGIAGIRKKGLPLLMKGFFSSSKIALSTNWLYLWFSSYEIMHSTYYFQKYLIRRRGKKHVVTLHDMIPEDFPHFFLRFNPHFQKEKFLRNADRIVCVSNYTMSRLAHHYPDLVHKARVIYPGVRVPASINLAQDRDSTILFVGARTGHKDFVTLLKSLPILFESEPSLQVLVAGNEQFSSSESALILELGLVGRVTQKDLTDQDLEKAYETCLALVVTSHAEGFGLPVIEAMAHGALVIATDIPVFKEIAGDAFLAFPPGNFSKLTFWIQSVLANPKAFDSIREKGRLNASQYTWKKTLSGLLNLYKAIGD
jgi:glycosyltransferase involved in cell wall biosynthesis